MKSLTRILLLCESQLDKRNIIEVLRANDYVVQETTKENFRNDQKKYNPEICIIGSSFGRIEPMQNTALVYIVDDEDYFKLKKDVRVKKVSFLFKPFTPASLLHQVESTLKNRELEIKLRISELKYYSLLEQAPIPVLIIKANNIIYINNEGLKLFGSEKNNLIHNDYHIILHPDIMDDFDIFLKTVISSGKNKFIYDAQLVGLNGLSIEADVALIPTVIKSSTVVQVLIKDFSALRKKEKTQVTISRILHASNSTESLEELFEFIYRIIEDVIPIRNMYIALYDKVREDLSFPFYKDEISQKPARRKLGNGLTEYIIHTHKSLLLDSGRIKEMIESEKISPSSVNIKAWLGIPLMIHEDIAGVLVIKEYHDEHYIGKEEKEFLEMVSFSISRAIERTLYENEREKYIRQLKELNETKDKFFSIISHDLRSPFNSILGFTEILKYQYFELEKEEAEQYIDSLYNSSRNIYNLVDNMLRFSRFQLGLMDFEPQSIELEPFVQNIIGILGGNALKKRIEIKNEINSSLSVYADKDMLNSIIQNLISNSIKFTESGGKITVKASQGNDFVKLYITDNGVGMDEKTTANIFKLDEKKSTLGTQNEKGTGLGLILVKDFIEKNGGTIEVKSQPNKGTEFCVTLKSKNVNDSN